MNRDLLVLAACLGCTHAPPPRTSTEGVAVVYVAQVPFFSVPAENGGASVLASVLAYYGVARQPAAILEDLPRTLGGGVLALDVALYPRRFGLQSLFGQGDLETLEGLLAAGHPVIVLLDEGRAPEYALVVGFDRARGLVVLYTAERSDVVVRLGEFRAAWGRAGRWMTVVGYRGRQLRPLPVQST